MGAPGQEGNAYLFDILTGDLLVDLREVLGDLAPDPIENTRLGEAVAAAEGILVVGAPEEDVPGFAGAGAVYVLEGECL